MYLNASVDSLIVSSVMLTFVKGSQQKIYARAQTIELQPYVNAQVFLCFHGSAFQVSARSCLRVGADTGEPGSGGPLPQSRGHHRRDQRSLPAQLQERTSKWERRIGDTEHSAIKLDTNVMCILLGPNVQLKCVTC